MSYVGYRHSDSVYRQCSRCGKELTDAASRERGTGPLCAAKNTAIFARQIPADIARSSAFILSLSSNDFHSDVAFQFEAIQTSYLSKIKKMTENIVGNIPMILSGSDFRKIIDWFDLALSYPIAQSKRSIIVEFINSMGYPALAGVLRGDVCMSPAKVYFEGNDICLSAKSSKPGFYAMRKAIPGVKTPRYRGDTTPYRANKQYKEKFLEVAYRYWPFLEISEQESCPTENMPFAEPTRGLESIPYVNMTNLPTEHQNAVVRLTGAANAMCVSFPWIGTNNDMYTMINKMKMNIPKDKRSYNPETKEWKFDVAYKGYIISLLRERYEEVIVENEVG